MARIPRRPRAAKGFLPYDEFVRKYGDELAGVTLSVLGKRNISKPPPAYMDGWTLRTLQLAKRENCPDAYRAALEFWLYRMDLIPPSKISIRSSRGAGAPRKDFTRYVALRRMQLGSNASPSTLAKDMEADKYQKANAKDRNALVQKYRQALHRALRYEKEPS